MHPSPPLSRLRRTPQPIHARQCNSHAARQGGALQGEAGAGPRPRRPADAAVHEGEEGAELGRGDGAFDTELINVSELYIQASTPKYAPPVLEAHKVVVQTS